MKSESVNLLLSKIAEALVRTRLNRNLTRQTVADRFGVGTAKRVLAEVKEVLAK